MSDALIELPAPPTPSECWWVAVENAVDPSGGWFVLADPGERGAKQIQATFQKAEIAILAAVSASDLETAVKGLDGQTIALRLANGNLQISRHDEEPAQVLVDLRLEHPTDRILLVESADPAIELYARMRALLESGGFEGVRMDLRAAPRGQGAWGLALVRSA